MLQMSKTLMRQSVLQKKNSCQVESNLVHEILAKALNYLLLTFSSTMLKNRQIFFKNLAVGTPQDF